MTTIHGSCDPQFQQVQTAFAGNFDQGLEQGASLAITIGGELVVDIWAGDADGNGRPWERDTITNVWSTTKTMAALCLLILADRGELDLDAPVAKYWPEFAANGKSGVLVRNVMSHTSGLPGWDAPITKEDLCDHDKVAGLLAAQAPWWEPGTKSGYHALSQGFLENEILRRITGVTLGQFFASEVAGPLGADFFIGTPASADDRVSFVVPPSTGFETGDGDPDSIGSRTAKHPALDAAFSSTEQWRRAEIPAANGHGNARSVALVQSIISGGGAARGVRLLKPATVERIFEEQVYADDLVLPMKMRHGIGYGLTSAELPISPNARSCFWGGWGGSLMVNDLESNMTFAYVMNKMGEGTTGDMRAGACLMMAHMALM